MIGFERGRVSYCYLVTSQVPDTAGKGGVSTLRGGHVTVEVGQDSQYSEHDKTGSSFKN